MHRDWNRVLLILTLLVATVGMTACAKYPMVTDSRASSPSASPGPSRMP